jgi:acetyl esterase/lipase
MLIILQSILLAMGCAAVSPLWASQAPAPAYPDKTHLLVYRDDRGHEHAITRPSQWTIRRQHILTHIQEVMGPLPDRGSRLSLDVRISEETVVSGYVRKKLTFAAEKDDRVPAYLLTPVGPKTKLPAVLCLHQTVSIGKSEPVGLGKSRNLNYAEHLAQRGYVTLAPDYPSFGEYPYDFGRSSYQSGSMKAIWNNMRAIDLLESLAEVDPEHIGCIGHSLGGHNALFTAVFDTRIKAVVSNCGFTSFPKYFGGKLKGWTSPRYMPRIASAYDSDPQKVPFDFTEVVACLAPRALLSCSPLHDDNFEVSGVRDVIAAARPVYELLGASENLAVYYPDCGHDFPPASRTVAYEWLDRWLKKREPK